MLGALASVLIHVLIATMKKISFYFLATILLLSLSGCANNNAKETDLNDRATKSFSKNLYSNQLFENGVLKPDANTLIRALVSSNKDTTQPTTKDTWVFVNEDYKFTKTGHTYFPFVINHTAQFEPEKKLNDEFVNIDQLYMYSLDRDDWIPISSYTWHFKNGEKVSEYKTDILEKDNDWIENFR